MSVVTFAVGKGIFRTWRGVFETVEPVVQFSDERQGEGEGAMTPVRKLTFVGERSKKTEVPVVSANSIRGILRRLIAMDLLSRVGLTIDDIGPRVVYLLTSGGGLEGKDRRRGNPDEPPPPPEPPMRIGSKAEVVEHLPVIGLFGASFLNAMIEGSARVGHAIPICKTTAKILGREDDPAADMSAPDLIGVTYQTRKDDRLQEGVDLDRGSRQQQIVRYEYIPPGVRLHHSLALEAATELQVSCLAHGMALFRQRPFLGGKWSGGFGRVAVDYEEIGDPKLYLNWVEEHKAKVRDYLVGLEPAARKAE